MADSPSILIFPYPDPDPDQVRFLSRLFRPIIVFQPLGMEPGQGLKPLVTSGAVRIVQPGQGRLSGQEVRSVLAELKSWMEGVRDVKEIAHLRGLVLEPEDDRQPPSALVTAIRRYGQSEEDSGLKAHLILHLAQYYDLRQSEAAAMMARLKRHERNLGRAAGLKAGPEETDEAEPTQLGLDPLDLPDPEEDPLLGLRLAAWAQLYKTQRVEAGLWLTDPVLVKSLAERRQELTGLGPELVGQLDVDRLDPAAVAGLLDRARQGEKIKEPTGDPRTELKLWRFDQATEESLLGLADGADRQSALIGQMSLRPQAGDRPESGSQGGS
ncbi:MAG: hypothetical protein JRJ59_10245 [Deltaproteobacteria bacterium]|nr:hypothetical protein [Deltaproteobacteria bacterium]